MLLRKLQPYIRKKFESSRVNSQNIPNVDEVIMFLEHECACLEAANYPNSQFHKVSQSNVSNTQANNRPNLKPTQTVLPLKPTQVLVEPKPHSIVIIS